MMKRHLAPALFSLSLCAVMGGVRTAGAQTLDAIPAAIDSMAPTATQPLATGEFVSTLRMSPGAVGPTILAPAAIQLRTTVAEQRAPIAPAAVMVDWKMPTSRALMIGGAATAITGVVAVKGDTGAIIGLAGTAVAVYGLYLHYTR